MPFVGLFAKRWFRLVESSAMIEIDLASLFYFGSSIRRLSDLRPNQPVSAWAFVLVEAREGLKAFLHNTERANLFPQARRWALSILNTVILMVPDVPPGTPVENHLITQEEVQGLHVALNSLATLLSEESARAYVVALQKQRTFDLYTLIEAVNSAFDDAMWDRFSEFTKRELKEAGRCLALERYTACGFHMMRAVERESRDCATLLAQALPVRRDFSDYVKTLSQHGVNTKVTSVLDNLRGLERNPLVHPEDWLTQDDAVNIFCIAQVALSRLISCIENMKLFPPRNKI
jgi:hypothetical protein